MKRFSLCACLVFAPTGVMRAAHADVTLTKDGKAVGVIVHNGFTGTPPQYTRHHDLEFLRPVNLLSLYLGKVAGGEFEQVETLAEAGDRPAIVFDFVDKLDGVSDREATARQAYRIRTEDNRLRLEATTELGMANAALGLLLDHLNGRFYGIKKSMGAMHGSRRSKSCPSRRPSSLRASTTCGSPLSPTAGRFFDATTSSGRP